MKQVWHSTQFALFPNAQPFPKAVASAAKGLNIGWIVVSAVVVYVVTGQIAGRTTSLAVIYEMLGVLQCRWAAKSAMNVHEIKLAFLRAKTAHGEIMLIFQNIVFSNATAAKRFFTVFADLFFQILITVFGLTLHRAIFARFVRFSPFGSATGIRLRNRLFASKTEFLFDPSIVPSRSVGGNNAV